MKKKEKFDRVSANSYIAKIFKNDEILKKILLLQYELFLWKNSKTSE